MSAENNMSIFDQDHGTLFTLKVYYDENLILSTSDGVYSGAGGGIQNADTNLIIATRKMDNQLVGLWAGQYAGEYLFSTTIINCACENYANVFKNCVIFNDGKRVDFENTYPFSMVNNNNNNNGDRVENIILRQSNNLSSNDYWKICVFRHGGCVEIDLNRYEMKDAYIPIYAMDWIVFAKWDYEIGTNKFLFVDMINQNAILKTTALSDNLTLSSCSTACGDGNLILINKTTGELTYYTHDATHVYDMFQQKKIK
jgi:hypothetical protein